MKHTADEGDNKTHHTNNYTNKTKMFQVFKICLLVHIWNI